MNAKFITFTAVALSMTGAMPALAQRGTGESTGIARETVRPAVVEVTGKLKAIEVGPCENTTGRYPIGSHLLLTTSDNKEINIHIGPAAMSKSLTKQLTVGNELKAKVFRTERMAKNHYVAQAVYVDGKAVELRDANLRPYWAGGRQGWGRGYGRGLDRADGPPWRRGGGGGYGYRWGCRP
jgi:hypothetical protein